VLRLSKAGYGDVTSNVDVASGTTPAFNLRLQPSQALVTVTVVGAPAAAIAVDKVDRGPAPFRGNLDPGAHTIEASASGFGTVSQTLDVSDAAPKTVTLAMSPEVHQGTLRITAPEGTSLFLDGQALGVGGWEGAVSSVGGHELVARRPGFQVYAVDVTVGDKEHKDFDVPLNKEVPTSWVIWGAGALLLVAGCVAVAVVVLKPADLSPFRGDLTPGITTARYGLHF